MRGQAIIIYPAQHPLALRIGSVPADLMQAIALIGVAQRSNPLNHGIVNLDFYSRVRSIMIADGVARQSICTWLKQSEFKKELDGQLNEITRETTGRLRTASGLAVDKLVAL